jgi:hypothetical protein
MSAIDEVAGVNYEVDLMPDRGVHDCLEGFPVDENLNTLTSADCRPIEP